MKKPAKAAQKEPVVSVQLKLPDELHTAIRLKAFTAKTTMKQYILDVLAKAAK